MSYHLVISFLRPLSCLVACHDVHIYSVIVIIELLVSFNLFGLRLWQKRGSSQTHTNKAQGGSSQDSILSMGLKAMLFTCGFTLFDTWMKVSYY